MRDDICARLSALLAQYGRDELLDDPRRLAELVRERLGNNYRREATILNTVMQEGMPKRLLSMPTTGVTATTLRSYATKISEDTALREDVVKSAVETWAAALGYEIRPSAPQGPPPPPPPPPRQPAGGVTGGRIDAGAQAQAGVRPAPASGAATGGPVLKLIGIGLLVQGAAKLAFILPFIGRFLSYFSGSLVQLIYLLAVAVAAASIPLGIGAIQRAPWARPTALVVCGLGAPIYLFYLVNMLGNAYAFRTGLQTLNSLANILGVVVHAGGFVCFLRWRPERK